MLRDILRLDRRAVFDAADASPATPTPAALLDMSPTPGLSPVQASPIARVDDSDAASIERLRERAAGLSPLPAVMCPLPVDLFEVTPTPHCTPDKYTRGYRQYQHPPDDGGPRPSRRGPGAMNFYDPTPATHVEGVGGSGTVLPAPPTPGDSSGVIMLKTPGTPPSSVRAAVGAAAWPAGIYSTRQPGMHDVTRSPKLRDYDDCQPAEACGVGAYDACAGMEVIDSPAAGTACEVRSRGAEGGCTRAHTHDGSKEGRHPRAGRLTLPQQPQHARGRVQPQPQQQQPLHPRTRSGTPRGARPAAATRVRSTTPPAAARRTGSAAGRGGSVGAGRARPARTATGEEGEEEEEDPVHIRLYCRAIAQQQRLKAKQHAARTDKQEQEDVLRKSGMNGRRVVLTPTRMQGVVEQLASTKGRERNIERLRAMQDRVELRECTFAPHVQGLPHGRRVCDEPFEERLHREAERRRNQLEATREKKLRVERAANEREKRLCNPKYAQRADERARRVKETRATTPRLS